MLMERDGLIEKHAKAAGIEVKTNWQKVAGPSVIDDAGTCDLLPVGFHLDAGRLGVFLDQAVAFHQHQRQERHAELLRDGDLGQLRARAGRACSSRPAARMALTFIPILQFTPRA